MSTKDLGTERLPTKILSEIVFSSFGILVLLIFGVGWCPDQSVLPGLLSFIPGSFFLVECDHISRPTPVLWMSPMLVEIREIPPQEVHLNPSVPIPSMIRPLSIEGRVGGLLAASPLRLRSSPTAAWRFHTARRDFPLLCI